MSDHTAFVLHNTRANVQRKLKQAIHVVDMADIALTEAYEIHNALLADLNDVEASMTKLGIPFEGEGEESAVEGFTAAEPQAWIDPMASDVKKVTDIPNGQEGEGPVVQAEPLGAIRTTGSSTPPLKPWPGETI